MSGTRLVGDVGGTNARFALLDDDNQPVSSSTLRTGDFSSLSAAVTTYLKQLDIDHVSAAAVAVATPVVGDAVKLTNNHWSFSIEATRRQLGLDHLHVVNDFTALALSVPHLAADELVKFGGGTEVPKHAKAIIGPGTGLGVSGLIPCGTQWTALQGEGGHVSLGVRTPREYAVYEYLKNRFQHVSAERFLSGPGLVNIVNALREIDGLAERDYSPAEVTEKGMQSSGPSGIPAGGETNGSDAAGSVPASSAPVSSDPAGSVPASSAPVSSDPACEEALQIFCQLLGSCAGNLVLTLGAEGGVYIGGGIVPRLGDFFLQSGFRREFEAKGRMRPYLEKVPSYVIHAKNPALIGAAQLLR